MQEAEALAQEVELCADATELEKCLRLCRSARLELCLFHTQSLGALVLSAAEAAGGAPVASPCVPAPLLTELSEHVSPLVRQALAKQLPALCEADLLTGGHAALTLVACAWSMVDDANPLVSSAGEEALPSLAPLFRSEPELCVAAMVEPLVGLASCPAEAGRCAALRLAALLGEPLGASLADSQLLPLAMHGCEDPCARVRRAAAASLAGLATAVSRPAAASLLRRLIDLACDVSPGVRTAVAEVLVPAASAALPPAAAADALAAALPALCDDPGPGNGVRMAASAALGPALVVFATADAAAAATAAGEDAPPARHPGGVVVSQRLAKAASSPDRALGVAQQAGDTGVSLVAAAGPAAGWALLCPAWSACASFPLRPDVRAAALASLADVAPRLARPSRDALLPALRRGVADGHDCVVVAACGCAAAFAQTPAEAVAALSHVSKALAAALRAPREAFCAPPRDAGGTVVGAWRTRVAAAAASSTLLSSVLTGAAPLCGRDSSGLCLSLFELLPALAVGCKDPVAAVRDAAAAAAALGMVALRCSAACLTGAEAEDAAGGADDAEGALCGLAHSTHHAQRAAFAAVASHLAEAVARPGARGGVAGAAAAALRSPLFSSTLLSLAADRVPALRCAAAAVLRRVVAAGGGEGEGEGEGKGVFAHARAVAALSALSRDADAETRVAAGGAATPPHAPAPPVPRAPSPGEGHHAAARPTRTPHATQRPLPLRRTSEPGPLMRPTSAPACAARAVPRASTPAHPHFGVPTTSPPPPARLSSLGSPERAAPRGPRTSASAGGGGAVVHNKKWAA